MSKEKLIGLIAKKETYRQLKPYLAEISKQKEETINASSEAITQILSTEFNSEAKLYAVRFTKDCFELGNPSMLEKIENNILPLLYQIVLDEHRQDMLTKYAGSSFTQTKDLTKFKSIVKSLFHISKQCIIKWSQWIPEPNRKFIKYRQLLQRENINTHFQFQYIREDNARNFQANYLKYKKKVQKLNNSNISESQFTKTEKTKKKDLAISIPDPRKKQSNNLFKKNKQINDDSYVIALENIITQMALLTGGKNQKINIQKKFNQQLNNYVQNDKNFNQDYLQDCFNRFQQAKKHKENLEKQKALQENLFHMNKMQSSNFLQKSIEQSIKKPSKEVKLNQQKANLNKKQKIVFGQTLLSESDRKQPKSPKQRQQKVNFTQNSMSQSEHNKILNSPRAKQQRILSPKSHNKVQQSVQRQKVNFTEDSLYSSSSNQPMTPYHLLQNRQIKDLFVIKEQSKVEETNKKISAPNINVHSNNKINDKSGEYDIEVTEKIKQLNQKLTMEQNEKIKFAQAHYRLQQQLQMIRKQQTYALKTKKQPNKQQDFSYALEQQKASKLNILVQNEQLKKQMQMLRKLKQDAEPTVLKKSIKKTLTRKQKIFKSIQKQSATPLIQSSSHFRQKDYSPAPQQRIQSPQKLIIRDIQPQQLQDSLTLESIPKLLSQANINLLKKNILGLSQLCYRDDSISVLAAHQTYESMNTPAISSKLTFQVGSRSKSLSTVIYKASPQLQIWNKPINNDEMLPTQQVVSRILKWPSRFAKTFAIVDGYQSVFIFPCTHLSFLKNTPFIQDQFDSIFQNRQNYLLKSKITPLNASVVSDIQQFKTIFPMSLIYKNVVKFCLSENNKQNIILLAKIQILNSNKFILKILSGCNPQIQRSRIILDQLLFLLSLP